jgi:hypothetical protein
VKSRLVIMLLVLLISACNLPSPKVSAPTNTPLPAAPTLRPTLPPASPTPVSTIAAPDLEKLKNGTYTLSILVNRKVTLVGGKFELSDPAKNFKASGRLVEPVAVGDINGDGLDDTALMIAANTGGTGTFYELILLLGQKGQVASVEVGDRIAVKAFAIQDGKIVLDYLRAGPNDGLCCPSQHAQTAYQLKDGMLEKIDDRVIP